MPLRANNPLEPLALAMLWALLLSIGGAAATRGEDPQPVEAVPSIDLDRYSGLWYELARLPNRFQKKCTCCVTALYEVRKSGDLTVVNQCTDPAGQLDRVEGRGRLARKGGPTSKLEVRFAPAFLSFLGAVWGDYWVLEVAPDYSHALVGSPDRRYLWVLSREPDLESEIYDSLMDVARRMGFDVARVEKTAQK